MDMPNRQTLRSFAAFCVSLGAFAFSSVTAMQAQAITGASKAAEITAFGGFTHIDPDYGPTKDNGFTLGASYIFYPGYWPVAPAVELRYMSVSGSTANEHAIMIGADIRSRKVFLHDRLTPYIDVLFGQGTIVFAAAPFPGYTQDTGNAFALGGGVDYYIAHDVSLKVDYQYPYWSFDKNFHLNPAGFTIGASYKIPFRSRVGSRYSRIEQLPPDRPAPAPKPAPAPRNQPAAPADQPAPSQSPADQASPAPQPAPADQTSTPAPPPADTNTPPPASTPASGTRP
jgi:opacity protein-like surface antigen